MNTRFLFASMIALGIMAAVPSAFAHGDAEHKKPAVKKAISKTEHAWGREGDPKKAVRTITVDMSDAMRFTPDKLEIKVGDTVKFLVRNKGKVLHEMVIGQEKELKEHAELMKKFPNMEHEEPYMAHVSLGKQSTITWQFTKPGDFMFGCLIPGHFEAGMVGRIKVKD